MGPTKIYKTEVDEFSSYARNCILDKKNLDHLRRLYDEWRNIADEALEMKSRIDSAKRDIKIATGGTPAIFSAEGLRVMELENQLNDLIKREEDAHQALQNYLEKLPQAPYDRYRLRDNFRNCLERTGIPLGELEVEGGISRGGFSRWEKTIMTSELPLSFLLTAADRFGVSLKELLYGDVTEQRAMDTEISAFMVNLTDLTNEEEMEWKKIDFQNTACQRFGLIISLTENGRNAYIRSLFEYEHDNEKSFIATDDAYYSEIPGSHDTICLFSLGAPRGRGEFVEMYIKAEGQQIEPLYSSRKGDEQTNSSLGDLFVAISSSIKRNRVSQGARQVMDRVARLVNRPGAARFVNRGGCANEGRVCESSTEGCTNDRPTQGHV